MSAAGSDAATGHSDGSPSGLPLSDAACSLPPNSVVHTFASTYSAVYREILSPTCALEFCHGGTGDFLQLWSENEGFASLVNAPAQGPQCAATGLKRVDPGHPETSLVYLKITGPPCGSKMPLEYGCVGILDPREIEQIRSWIACGAPNGDAGCGGEAGLTDASND